MSNRSYRETSFGRMLDKGISKEEIMKHFGIDEKRFEKLKSEIERIRREKKEKEEQC